MGWVGRKRCVVDSVGLDARPVCCRAFFAAFVLLVIQVHICWGL